MHMLKPMKVKVKPPPKTNTYSGLTTISTEAIATGETPFAIWSHVAAHLNILFLGETAHNSHGPWVVYPVYELTCT